jgi:hypothetical protein
MTTFNVTISQITYCGFSAVIPNTGKVVYCHKFPPNSGTVKPDFNTIDRVANYDNHVKRETFIKFIKNESSRQANGSWKGGEWGDNNFTVTSENWFSGLYIGDTIQVTIVAEGIVKFSPTAYDSASTHVIVDGTESKALTCVSTWNGVNYNLYMTNNPMPQDASDTLFVWSSPKKTMIKVMRRGKGKNVDSPARKIPCAGEHLEPGQANDDRSQAIFALNQEIGVPETTLSKCYIINLGEYSDPGRDPRYWTYSEVQDEQVIEFGFERASKTKARIVYIKTDDEVEPREINPSDTEEIGAKWWANIHTVLEPTKPGKNMEDDWMMFDHMRFIPDTIKKLEWFNQLSAQEKENYRF